MQSARQHSHRNPPTCSAALDPLRLALVEVATPRFVVGDSLLLRHRLHRRQFGVLRPLVVLGSRVFLRHRPRIIAEYATRLPGEEMKPPEPLRRPLRGPCWRDQGRRRMSGMAWVSGQARAKHQRGGRPAARESDRRLDGKHAPWSFPNPPLPWGDQPEPCAPTARPRGPFRQSGGQGPPSKSTRYHGSLPAKREWETGRLPFRREAQPVPLGARGGRGGTEHPSARLDALSPGGRNRRASETVGGPPPARTGRRSGFPRSRPPAPLRPEATASGSAREPPGKP